MWRDVAGVADHDWDRSHFALTELSGYVDGCAAWREDLS